MLQNRNMQIDLFCISTLLHVHCLERSGVAFRSSIACNIKNANKLSFHSIVLSLLLIDYVVVVVLIPAKEKLIWISPQLDLRGKW